MKTKERDKTAVARRDFLRVIGTGAAVAATAPLVTPALADSESNQEKRKTRYKESEHVKAYYRSNRYPS